MARTILLADDSLTIQKVVEMTFEESAFEVVATSSGEEALAELSRLQPAVVIADVHMPGASGYEVARRVKERSPQTPVMLLVGTFEPFDKSECDASGADTHLLKPFESKDLRQRVEALAGPEQASDATSDTSPTAPSGELAAAEETLESISDRGALDEAPEVVEEAGRATAGPEVELTEEAVDRIARRVVGLISADAVREIARDVVPRLAEEAIQRRIEELERDVE